MARWRVIDGMMVYISIGLLPREKVSRDSLDDREFIAFSILITTSNERDTVEADLNEIVCSFKNTIDLKQIVRIAVNPRFQHPTQAFFGYWSP